MNQEGYDSWEGFVSAGFAAEDDGGIHLAGAKGWCNVWRRRGTSTSRARPGRGSRSCWRMSLRNWRERC